MSAPVAEGQRGADIEWHRLDIRLVVVALSVVLGPLAGLVSIVVIGNMGGLRLLIAAASVFVTAMVVAAIVLARITTTRFRIAGDWFEVRTGALFRTEHLVPLARVASVDITRGPLHRLAGLATVRVGTGDVRASTERRLTLDGLRLDRAQSLRRELLERRLPVSDAVADPALVRLERSWIRYAPLSVWGVGAVLTAAGSAYRFLHEFGFGLDDIAAVLGLEGRAGALPLWFGVLAVCAGLVVVGVVLPVAAFVENWSNYALDRGADGLQLRRGLLTTRSVTVPWAQIHGVELVEPLLYRAARAASIAVIATGLGTVEENRRRRRLSPGLPRPVAIGLADEVVRHTVAVAGAVLTAHPAAGAVRRLRFGLVVVGCAVATLLVSGAGTGWTALYVGAAATAVVGFPAVGMIARESHRSLGHATIGAWLILRAGVFPRRTIALHTDAVIGWGGSRSPFQRRHGLLTLTASTAAGEGAYRIRDMSEKEGVALVHGVAPGILKPFLCSSER